MTERGERDIKEENCDNFLGFVCWTVCWLWCWNQTNIVLSWGQNKVFFQYLSCEGTHKGRELTLEKVRAWDFRSYCFLVTSLKGNPFPSILELKGKSRCVQPTKIMFLFKIKLIEEWNPYGAERILYESGTKIFLPAYNIIWIFYAMQWCIIFTFVGKITFEAG